MAVKLRLARYGKKRHPFYRVVVADAEARRDGRFIEQLGTYDPAAETDKVALKWDRVDHWLATGALPTQTVKDLFRKHRPNEA